MGKYYFILYRIMTILKDYLCKNNNKIPVRFQKYSRVSVITIELHRIKEQAPSKCYPIL